MKFNRNKSPKNGIYICYWEQDKYHKGWEIFNWIGDRWCVRNTYINNSCIEYVVKYFKLPKV